MPIPDRILNAPLLPACLEFFVNAFWELSTCRSSGMGLGPIPLTAIFEYGRFYDCSDDLMEDLKQHVQMLDGVYMKHEARKSKAKTSK